jgi:uncharacterized protein (DUF1778 family)
MDCSRFLSYRSEKPPFAMYGLMPYTGSRVGKETTNMARRATEGNNRVELRVRPAEKAILARAAALQHMDLTGFILSRLLPEARAVIERAERVALSGRDSLKVLDLLENPPKPNARLKRAAKAGHRLP